MDTFILFTKYCAPHNSRFKFFHILAHTQVTGSHDKSIRLWQRTEELLVTEEEREHVS